MTDDPDARYLIRKRGAFYRPNAEGYTNNRTDAGRFTLAEAVGHSHPNGPNGPRDGIDYIPAGTDADQVDRLAQFLHDEGGFADSWSGRTWPEHADDTGQRGDGFVKIVPTDVVAKFRDIARRWLQPSPDGTTENDRLRADLRNVQRNTAEYREQSRREVQAIRDKTAPCVALVARIAGWSDDEAETAGGPQVRKIALRAAEGVVDVFPHTYTEAQRAKAANTLRDCDPSAGALYEDAVDAVAEALGMRRAGLAPAPVESMAHRCETCGVKDSHAEGCAENEPPEDPVERVRNVIAEFVECARLRGDNELPHPCDDPKLWTARMAEAWGELEAIADEDLLAPQALGA